MDEEQKTVIEQPVRIKRHWRKSKIKPDEQRRKVISFCCDMKYYKLLSKSPTKIMNVILEAFFNNSNFDISKLEILEKDKE